MLCILVDELKIIYRELRYYLIVATDLGYGETQQHAEALDRVGKLLAGYIKAIARDSSPFRALRSAVAPPRRILVPELNIDLSPKPPASHRIPYSVFPMATSL